jgi:hypothetical protein
MNVTVHHVPSHPSKPWAIGLELGAGVFQVTCYCETRELAERVVECLNQADEKPQTHEGTIRRAGIPAPDRDDHRGFQTTPPSGLK